MEIQIWTPTINCKVVVEAVINRPVSVLSHLNFFVPTFLLNTMPEKDIYDCYPHTQRHCSHQFKITALCHPIFI